MSSSPLPPRPSPVPGPPHVSSPNPCPGAVVISLPRASRTRALQVQVQVQWCGGEASRKKKACSSVRERLSQLCKEGRLDVARRLLELLPRPAPAILWNTLLIGYVCNAMPFHALRLYALMNSSSPPIFISDHYAYSSALKACADARQLRLGKSIHCHILRRSPAPPKNRILNNSLLSMYASASAPPSPSGGGRFDVVRSLFDRMPKRNVVSWNTLIAWYVRSQRPADALARFRLMLGAGIPPTPVTFIHVLAAVSEMDDARVLYGLLIKHGSHYANDQFVVSSAISMYCALTDMESAERVFDQAEEKNTPVWNTMIGAYVQNGQFRKAIALLLQVLESQAVSSDTVTFLSSLMAVSHLQDVSLGRQIHALLLKKENFRLHLSLGNALVVMYSRCGCVRTAFELFHQLRERDIVSWNTVISALVQNGLNSEGLLLVHEMQRQGFAVDFVTVMALLSASSNLGSIEIGRETHAHLIRRGIWCEGMESYLIDMYAKSGAVETARRIFDGIRSDERDQVTWNAMIAGYSQSGQAEDAIAVFRRMLRDECEEPNSVTLASVLPSCSPVGGVEAGRQIHGFAVRRCLDGDVFVGTALVDMYSKRGEISSAERVFDGMAEKNTVTYTTMLSGFGQHGLGERAASLFRSMQELGVKPDAVTFVAVLSACSYSGMIDEGLAAYESMEKFGVAPTPEHHCCAVDLLGRAGRVEEAYEFVERLGDEGNFVGILGSLLAACKVHGKFEMGKLVSERLFKMMIEEEIDGAAAGYRVLLSNVYAAEGSWHNVDRVRKEMRERGLRKEPGSSWIEVRDAPHRFMSRDQNHPENDQIYAMLQNLAWDMKTLGFEDLDPRFVDGASEL